MDIIKMLYDWSISFINGAGTITTVLNYPINLGTGQAFTVLGLVSIGGLLVYLGVALVKWIIS